LDRQQVTRDGHARVLLADTGELEDDEQVVLRLVHVDQRGPEALARRRRGRSPEKAVEQSIHLALDVGWVPEGLPPLQHRPEWTPPLCCHISSLLIAPALLFSGNLSTSSIYQMSLFLSNQCLSWPSTDNEIWFSGG